jgi:hypothetical protein
LPNYAKSVTSAFASLIGAPFLPHSEYNEELDFAASLIEFSPCRHSQRTAPAQLSDGVCRAQVTGLLLPMVLA